MAPYTRGTGASFPQTLANYIFRRGKSNGVTGLLGSGVDMGVALGVGSGVKLWVGGIGRRRIVEYTP